jgi:hypothetical protein
MIMNLLLSVSMRMLVAVIVMMGHKASFGSIGCVSFNRIRSNIDFLSPVIRRFPVKKIPYSKYFIPHLFMAHKTEYPHQFGWIFQPVFSKAKIDFSLLSQ